MTGQALSTSGGVRQRVGDVPVLRCSDLDKSFGTLHAVEGVSFRIGPGETYGLLGPNGAGKTTTISMVAGVLDADSGVVELDGRTMDTRSLAAKARIGYVPQDVALYPDLSARENLQFFAALYRLSRQQRQRRVAEVLDVVGLAERADGQVAKFSGGMRRRLNIAVGLIHRPQLLILDEPTVGVDPQSRNSILENIGRLSGEGMAVLYTTHYMEEAERLCDRVGIMDRGRLIAEGTPRELTAGLGDAGHIELSVQGHLQQAVSSLGALAVASRVTASDTTVDVLVTDARSALPAVMDAVARSGATIRTVNVREPDLETLFLRLTGKTLRD